MSRTAPAEDPVCRRWMKAASMAGGTGIVAAAMLIVSACGGGRSETPPFTSSDISDVKWGRDFRLTDHAGTARSIGDFKGKVVMLFFGFTHCPDVCPTAMADMAQVIKRLGKDGRRVQGLFVTVDPQRDTPPVLAKYVTAFDPGFLGLYADEHKTAALAKEFKIFHQAQPADAKGGYMVAHSNAIYVYDPRGRLRLLMGPGRTVDTMVADVAMLLKESGR